MKKIVAEGMGAGVLGAAAVATWFLLYDAAQGRPYFTPALLGAWQVLGNSSDGCSSWGGQYLIVDVSGGSGATSYPVTYQSAAPDLTGSGNLEFKTSKIVLRWR